MNSTHETNSENVNKLFGDNVDQVSFWYYQDSVHTVPIRDVLVFKSISDGVLLQVVVIYGNLVFNLKCTFSFTVHLMYTTI